jgi:hypothetical protein
MKIVHASGASKFTYTISGPSKDKSYAKITRV